MMAQIALYRLGALPRARDRRRLLDGGGAGAGDPRAGRDGSDDRVARVAAARRRRAGSLRSAARDRSRAGSRFAARSRSPSRSRGRAITCGCTRSISICARASWEGGALTEVGRGDQMIAFGFGRIVPAGRTSVTVAYTGHTVARSGGPVSPARRRARLRVLAGRVGVRRGAIMPCFDEPRLKTPWKVTLVVPKGDWSRSATCPPVTRVAARRPRRRGRRSPRRRRCRATCSRSRSARSSSSTSARSGARKIPVRVAVARGDRRAASASRAQAARGGRRDRGVHRRRRCRGRSSIWSRCRTCSARWRTPGSSRSMPTMLVGDPTTMPIRDHFVRVAAHELAHQWFGNSVTPAWWDDLWLSEAFASWLGDKVARQLGALDDAPLALALDAARRRSRPMPTRRPRRCARRSRRQRRSRRRVRRDRVREGRRRCSRRSRRSPAPTRFATRCARYLAEHEGGTGDRAPISSPRSRRPVARARAPRSRGTSSTPARRSSMSRVHCDAPSSCTRAIG